MFKLRIDNSATFFLVRIMGAMISQKSKSIAIPVTGRGGL
jgi:hypothetical protein